MSLPHFDHQDDLDSPSSFQRLSQGLNRATGRRRNVHSKHEWVSNGEEEPQESAVTTITSPTTSCMTATPPASSLAEMRACSRDPHQRTASLGKTDTNSTAPPQSRLALLPVTRTATKTATTAARFTFFDPWNSSSSGHQRAENRLAGSTSWRESRNKKLREQFLGGISGGADRVADTVGAGSEEFEKTGQKANGGWEKGAKGLRSGGQRSLVEVWGASKDVKGSKERSALGKEPQHVRVCKNREASTNVDLAPETLSNPPTLQGQKQIFAGLCFYVNGSTAPLVSDLKLKQLLAERGGRTSLGLGRRSVTHVILGTANGQGGAGGGLAATKIQKEIARVSGKGVKFVGVEWVLSSIRLNARQSEYRFSSLKLAVKGQNSVHGMLLHSPSSNSITRDEKSEASNG